MLDKTQLSFSLLWTEVDCMRPSFVCKTEMERPQEGVNQLFTDLSLSVR